MRLSIERVVLYINPMTSPLQVLFFFAITLAPRGTHHVTISGGDQVYSWDKGDSSNGAATWVYDASESPTQVLDNNEIIPANFSSAERETVQATHYKGGEGYVLNYDPAHQLERTSQGYVYIVRPGSVNQKFYAFKFY